MKKSLIKYALVGSTLLAAPVMTFAQAGDTTITLERGDDIGVKDLGTLISSVFNAAIVFAILFVFGMLLWGGYGWLTAGGDKSKVEEARSRITNAIIGLAIVASAWALITIIAQFFGVDFESFTLKSAAGESSSDSGSL